MDNRPIGIFDSGLGGLTVFKEIKEILPNEDIVYLGDTARVPYGTRSKNTIIKFSLQCSYFLAGKGAKCIIVACNTASSNAFDELRKQIKVPIFNVVDAAVKDCEIKSQLRKIGIIGTPATIRSRSHKRKLNKLGRKVVFEIACPLFVPLIEEGETSGDIISGVSRKYIGSIPNCDGIILACTHYPLIENVIRKTVGDKVHLINPAIKLSKILKEFLTNSNLEKKKGTSKYEYFVTDMDGNFSKLGNLFLGEEIKSNVKVVEFV